MAAHILYAIELSNLKLILKNLGFKCDPYDSHKERI